MGSGITRSKARPSAGHPGLSRPDGNGLWCMGRPRFPTPAIWGRALSIDQIRMIYLLQPQCVLDSEGNASLATCGRKAAGNGAGAGG